MGDLQRSSAGLTDELPLGITILSMSGTTTVPRQVREVLKLEPTLRKREKILWTQEGDEIIVSKGTPQSSYKKTMLRRGGRTAVPKHVREALKLKSTLNKEERMTWIRKGDRVIVRKGTPRSSPSD
jgi:bifunctional DNA-binding transcriptional regulator/antitoxin component of YhaV-PrlF toxin-antitoxin module